MTARLSFVELETGLAPRSVRLAHAEVEIPDLAGPGGGDGEEPSSAATITHVARYQRLPRSGIGHIHRS